MRNTIWKPIPNFENYECSNDGEFKRNGKILKQTNHIKGYKHIRLYKDSKQFTFRSHRIIYETFIGPIANGKEINHLNGLKNDNRIENLEMCTHSENLKHAIKTHLLKIKIGKECKLSKAIIGTNLKTGEIIKFDSQADAKRAGFNQGNIQSVLNKKRNHANGFSWDYS